MDSTLQGTALVVAKTTPKATTRSILRWIHIVFSVPILGYILVRLKDFQTTPATPRNSITSGSCRMKNRGTAASSSLQRLVRPIFSK
jgi:hypothetical protein